MVTHYDCFDAAVNLCRQTHTQWESGIMDNPNMKDRQRGEFINKSVFKLNNKLIVSIYIHKTIDHQVHAHVSVIFEGAN